MAESVRIFEKRKSAYADASLFLVALMWGGGFIAVKDSLNHITPLYINAFRFILASLVMSLIFWKRLVNIKRKDIISGSIVGVILFLAFLTQTIGLQYTTVGKQAFLTGTNVVIVPFLAWAVYKKSPGWHSILAGVLSLVGIGLLTLQGNAISINLGDGLTLVCAVFFAAHIVSVGYFASDVDPVILSVVQMGFAALLSLLCALIFEPMPSSINKSALGGIAYLAFFSTMLAFLIQNVAQKYTPSTHAALILCLESVFGSILGVLILKDIFTGNMVIGCLIILCAIIIAETKLSFFAFIKNKVETAKE